MLRPDRQGKSTTLFACLQEINDGTTNITTIEDPVEYRVAGVNQVEVNAKRGLTFASVLRSLLRQDPDIIYVGEIRDRETADLGVRAALTGHLLLSTLHTNTRRPSDRAAGGHRRRSGDDRLVPAGLSSASG